MVVLNEATVRTHCLSVWVGGWVGVGVEGGGESVCSASPLFSFPPSSPLSLSPRVS